MDTLSAELSSFLVCLGMRPGAVPREAAHYTEHLLHLLDPADEADIAAYYGLFGTPQEALADLAARRSLAPEAMMERIDKSLRRLAVTPEWQVIRQRAAGRNGGNDQQQ